MKGDIDKIPSIVMRLICVLWGFLGSYILLRGTYIFLCRIKVTWLCFEDPASFLPPHYDAIAHSGIRVSLGFFGPVFFVLDLVFLWLAVFCCLKAECLLTLHWGFCFDLVIPIKGLLASIRGRFYWEPLKLLMKYGSVTWVNSIEDVSMWDCASAIWCINQYILRYCLAKYFYFYVQRLICALLECICTAKSSSDLKSVSPVDLVELWHQTSAPLTGICCHWVCPATLCSSIWSAVRFKSH